MLLNRTRLEALVSYFGPADTADMIVRAIDGLTSRMGDLRAAPDASAARRLGHEIKGIAGMYGLDTVAAAALAIEQQATDGTVPGLVITLEQQMADATRELGAFAAGLASSGQGPGQGT